MEEENCEDGYLEGKCLVCGENEKEREARGVACFLQLFPSHGYCSLRKTVEARGRQNK